MHKKVLVLTCTDHLPQTSAAPQYISHCEDSFVYAAYELDESNQTAGSQRSRAGCCSFYVFSALTPGLQNVGEPCQYM